MYTQYEEATSNEFNLAVSLTDYIKLLGLDECGFWGVSHDDLPDSNCPDIWTAYQRYLLGDALATAQSMMEEPLAYPLKPRWITGLASDQVITPQSNDVRWVDSQILRNPVITRWGMVLETGVLVRTVVEAGASVTKTNDPHTVSVGPVVYDSLDDIVVRLPDSEVVIEPSSITDDGSGNLTISIPRCRTVKLEFRDNPTEGLNYDTLTNFTDTVDVYNYETSDATQGVLVSNHTCNTLCNSLGCTDYTQDACIYVRDHRTGEVEIVPSTYADGTWTTLTAYSCLPTDKIRLNYKAGTKRIPNNMKMAIIRLAHTLMAEAPCGCRSVTTLWDKDRMIPTFITPQRDQCPFGLMDGAWWCWKQLQTSRLVRASVL